MDKPRSVTVLAHGGLGNQLFQLAAGTSMGRSPRVLSYGGGWGSGHPTLADLGISVKYPNRLDRTCVPGIQLHETWRDAVSSAVAKRWGRLRGIEVITQRHPFSPKPERSFPSHVVLNGYFQHPTWWHESWRAVAERVAEHAPVGARKDRSSSPPVVKIRRSDYLDLGWALSQEWFAQAFQVAGLINSDVIVLAEDKEGKDFVAPILHEFGCSAVPIPEYVQDRDLNDFWIIASANVIISSNSSFSWWGAAVAEVLGGASVVYPEPWMPDHWLEEPRAPMGLPHWLPVQAIFS